MHRDTRSDGSQGQHARWFRLLAVALAVLAACLLVFNLSLGDKQFDRKLECDYPTADPRFGRNMGAILGSAIVPGNQVEALINGDQIFPAMLDAIRSAKRSITLETYIFFSGTIAREFVDALIERAHAGVKVHMLLDWVGGRLDGAQLQRMRENGVAVRRYHVPRWNDLQTLNNRTHRKLMIVDGRVGFTGGVGIADKWRGDAQDPQHWRDTHFRVTGPVVAQMQATFDDNWMQAAGEVLHGDDYFPQLSPAGTQPAQMFSASPGGGNQSMQLLYLLSIASAKRSIDLSASYFVPDEAAIAQLVAAMRRGVRLRIIVPGEHIDWEIVRRASRARWGPLLDAGAEIHEYHPTMYHVKMMIVDGLWVTVGSTNFDPRSFAINDEANLDILDSAFAQRQTAIFEADLKESRRITREAWRARSWYDRLLDSAASLIGSQL
jgi:cardiolipin synthase